MPKESCRPSSGTYLVADMLNSFSAYPARLPARLALHHDDVCSRPSGLPLKASIRECADSVKERVFVLSLPFLCIRQELNLP